MTDPHEHNWWRTPSGALECACGKSRRPIQEETPMPDPQLYPLQDLTEHEAAEIARFEILEGGE